ncbi:DUF2878 domain-containing protein [Pseudoalteromonas haloplanktis]|uniref:DUF2878 domain-containing protein n=1 Tax=Pseudoalteromonas haloplanktis TaxID=228 RepID=A0ABU1B5X7_PSEHA|nr:DUF2878 domain-containing protein [Pseudoalteromonas haloplanktis]MDQ9089985.1 DUF2878 domain-containing protein [Pseudoalteromonas haloplanktis]
MILHSVINFALFQSVWFMALFLENSANFLIAAVLILMLWLSKQRKQDSLLLLLGLSIALCFEYIMVQFDLLGFKSNPYPIWLVLLWSALLLTVNTSMQFLTRLPWYLSCVLCTVFAPASYWAGARFEVITIAQPLWFFWLVYGLSWALMFTLIIFANKKIATYLLLHDRYGH